MTDLVFLDPPDTELPSDLVFNAGTAPPVEETGNDLIFSRLIDASLPADLVFNAGEEPPPAAHAHAVLSVSLGLVISVHVSAHYDNSVDRGVRNQTASRWQSATRADHQIQAPFVQSGRTDGVKRLSWRTGAAVLPSRSADWQTNVATRHDGRLSWGTGADRQASFAGSWRQLSPKARPTNRLTWEMARAVEIADALIARNLSGRARPMAVLPWDEATPASSERLAPMGTAVHIIVSERTPWWEGIAPAPGKHTPPGGGTEPPHVCYHPAIPADLVFSEAPDGTANLVFVCGGHDEPPGATIVIPVRRVYMQLNTTTLTRVSDGMVIPTYSMSAKIDTDSWVWGVDATVPAEALPYLQPTDGIPVELDAAINGFHVRMIVEARQRSRQFPRSQVQITCRGKAALLDTPYAAVQTFSAASALTAQQIMNAVLTVGGVSIGWDVDWQITDWLVPAGVWSHQGTYIDAANTIAAAAGAFIQPHPVDQTLRVLHRYPVLPWDWADATPDIELPADVVQTEGITWSDKVLYNRVFVAGQQSGRMVQVTRSGTAGDSVAPMITDPLITHVDAGRQRGSVVLADTGSQALVSLRLPVLTDLGVIEPGKLIRYVDGGVTRIGISRSVSVDIQMPTVYQTIGVETHGI